MSAAPDARSRSGPARLLLADRRALERLRAATSGAPRYRALGSLARDAERVELRVWDAALERELAMTVLQDAAPRRRIDEACITASLDHPGIPPVHELGVDANGRFYVTRRPLAGATFADVIDDAATRGGRWSRARALELLLRACDTLAYAHSRGVAHGDVAPADLVVGEFGETYLAGWGDARFVREEPAGDDARAPFAADVLAMGAILRRLLDAQGTPAAELDAIAAKAAAPSPAAPSPAARYPDARALADDLRAFLENRVVAAHRTGAFAELRKWVARNRAGAAAAIAAVLIAVGALTVLDVVARRKNGELREARDEAQRHADDVGRLASLKRVRDLVARADALWPAVAAQAEAMDAWLAEARELLRERDVHAATAAALLARRIAGSEPESPRFADPVDAWWHESLAQLRAQLDALAADEPFRSGTIAEMTRRLERARTIAARSIDDARDEWDDAIEAIAADPRYGGLQLRPQVGLVPLGPDPESGLWEFWHVESGERPELDEGGSSWRIEEPTGLLLVLLPGGATWYCGQGADAALPNFDPNLGQGRRTWPVELAPFFLSKFEMTQAQWLRATGANPSAHAPGSTVCAAAHGLLHPVDWTSWRDATTTLRGLGLELPTSAQWEYAMRAGTSTPFPTGLEVASLNGAGNLADRSFYVKRGIADRAEARWDDGFACSAPVGRFRPNAFGLFDMVGNVLEPCRDLVAPSAELRFAPDDGETLWTGDAPTHEQRVLRGASWNMEPALARSADRYEIAERGAVDDIGVRPARRLDR